jgi:hypothetical protein
VGMWNADTLDYENLEAANDTRLMWSALAAAF